MEYTILEKIIYDNLNINERTNSNQEEVQAYEQSQKRKYAFLTTINAFIYLILAFYSIDLVNGIEDGFFRFIYIGFLFGALPSLIIYNIMFYALVKHMTRGFNPLLLNSICSTSLILLIIINISVKFYLMVR